MKAPKIRFQGFDGDWEERKLGEIAKITMGQSPDGATYSDVPSDYILVQGNADLKDGWVSPRMWTTQKTKTADAGDLIMSVRAPAGAMGKTAYDVVLGRGVAGIKGNEFLYQTLVKIDKDGYWKKLAAGSTFESINSDAVNNAKLILPKQLDEQNKIGSYFSHLDSLITLHQRKSDDLKEVKKYMLQKMFPKKGEKVPEIRFAGFTGDWEEKKLGDILENRKIFMRQNDEYHRLAFAAGQGVIEVRDRKSNNRDQLIKDEYEKKYLVTELDDIVYNPANLKYGAIDRNKLGKGLISPIYVTFTTNQIPGFIERIVVTERFKTKALHYEEGTVTKRQSVNVDDLLTLKEYITSNADEQKKISAYFDKLDSLITLHQRKSDELKTVKKYMLQKMFV